MSKLIRSPKDGNNWTDNELLAYRIDVTMKKEEEFFCSHDLTLPTSLSENFLTYEFKAGEYVPEDSDELLGYLDMASRGREPMVNDFIRELLRAMNFQKKGRLIRTRFFIPLVVCGESRTAQTDVAITRRDKELLLLVQEDKRLISAKDPLPQLIAEAIAAFQENNRIRKERGLQEIPRMIFPCIIMTGTFPRFYLIPVTKELSNCVITAQCPSLLTLIFAFIPKTSRGSSESMKPVEDRKRILMYYEGFKKFVDELEEILKSE
jgi:hypothetical protein